MTYDERHRCAPCAAGSHGQCEDVFVCWCDHCPTPDQLTIDDALAATTEETR